MWHVLIRAILAAIARTNSVRVATLGRLQFTGLIANRPLSSVTQQEVRNAFARHGLREAHNSHFISRLIERGPTYGIRTLNDLGRAITNGTVQAGRHAGTTEIALPNGRAAVVLNLRGDLVTFRPL